MICRKTNRIGRPAYACRKTLSNGLRLLTMRWFLLSLALLCGVAQSHEPLPSARKGGEKPQAQTAKHDRSATKDERGTEKAPIVVKTLPAEKTKEETDHERYEHHEKPTLDRILSYATIALVGVTAALAFFTYFLWGEKWLRLFEQLSPIYKWTPGGSQTVQCCPRRRSALATNRPTRWTTRGTPRFSSYAASANFGKVATYFSCGVSRSRLE